MRFTCTSLVVSVGTWRVFFTTPTVSASHHPRVARLCGDSAVHVQPRYRQPSGLQHHIPPTTLRPAFWRLCWARHRHTVHSTWVLVWGCTSCRSRTGEPVLGLKILTAHG